MRFVLAAVLVVIGSVALGAHSVVAQDAVDRHEGYYYPETASQETYVARAVTLPQATRIGFVTGMTAQQLKAPFPPQFAIFAKGDEAQKLIIVALNDTAIGTVYRARALLAQLTAQVRTTQFFQELGVADFFTFFDMAKIMGFEQITISDGDRFSHQVLIR
jgi:hypothetical protein